MSDPLERLEPRTVWEHFSAVAAIPRPSKHEERIVGWVRSVASEHGWDVRTDRVGNLVVAVPASPGREGAPIVILQAHLDMVCEKNKDVDHDFMKDPIRTRVEGDWVCATGTTLGADNGMGVAAAMAAATDPDVEHGPLELLFTLDEETGLTGAQGLDGSLLRGRLLINLDSEEDGKLFVGCAGGADCQLSLDVRHEPVPAGSVAVSVEIGGLRGGHSGLNIHENRGNALKLVARALSAALQRAPELRLVGIVGGSKHNAIPREAEAVVVVSHDQREALELAIAEAVERFRNELAGIDDGLEVKIGKSADPVDGALSPADSRRLLDLLAVLPHGVLGMSPDVPGLVETSHNLAVVRSNGNGVEITTSARSSITSAMEAVVASVHAAARLARAGIETTNSYPGWKPDMDSRALQAVRRAWTELYGEPEVTAVHAGLECGLLGEKLPEVDMVSFGPQIEGAHSPDERVQISSVERFWRALTRTLESLSRDGAS